MPTSYFPALPDPVNRLIGGEGALDSEQLPHHEDFTQPWSALGKHTNPEKVAYQDISNKKYNRSQIRNRSTLFMSSHIKPSLFSIIFPPYYLMSTILALRS